MDLPKIYQKEPSKIELKEGKNYAWCSCGLSKRQPLCDGSHQGTKMSPTIFKVEETKEYFLCNCKHTKDHPFCDGTHHKI